MSAEETPVSPDTSGVDDLLLADLLHAALARATDRGWRVSEDEFWTRVTPEGYAFRRQGWKLHVSATPLSAPVVLARCAAILLASGCAFKFAGDLRRAESLVGAHCPRGNSGKFITAYPASDDLLRELAGQLDTATADLSGPRILSDRRLRPDSLVYYRYGVIGGGEPTLSNDGSLQPMLVAPDGATVPDKRRAWFSPPPWAASPFPGEAAGERRDGTQASAVPAMVRLGDRFLVRRAIMHAYKGGVYVAMDAEEGAEVIIKQAREHVGGYLDGQDCRDDLRHEARMLDVFAPLGISPRKIALFEQEDSVFLAEELIPGTRLTEWAATSASNRQPGDRHQADVIAALAIRLADVLAAAHTTGLVLRDFNPNNLMVTPDEQLRLIDLEYVVRPGTRVARRYTPGFSAPGDVARPYFGPAPGQQADLFSLGATLFYLATGVSPDFAADTPAGRSLAGRLGELIAVMTPDNRALAALAPLILGLMDDDEQRRWPLARAREFLASGLQSSEFRGSPVTGGSACRPGRPGLDAMVRDGVAHLLRTMRPEMPRLWEAGEFGNTTDPCNVQYGAAGVAAVLARTGRVEDYEGLRAGTAAVAAWIEDRVTKAPRILPGLYFGRSGIAWALHEVAGYLGDADMAARAVALAASVPVEDWGNPDIAHGLGGAGLAHLYLWRATGSDGLRERALRCADAVLHAAEVRGEEMLWPIPAGFDSELAGLAHYGLAHGVAGAGLFLLYCSAIDSDERLMAAALAAGRTLSHAAVIDGGAARWPSAPGENADKSMQHWCSGASGIGSFLIRLWAVTRDDRLRDLADAAAVTVVRQRWQVGNAACHGLAGDGDFLLDMARVTGQDKYLDWAFQIAAVLHARRVYADGLMVAAGEDPKVVTAGYNTGLAGVISFFDRLLRGGPRPWLPDGLLEL